MSKLNKKLIFHITGLLLMFNGLAMSLATITSYMLNDGVFTELLFSHNTCYFIWMDFDVIFKRK